MIHYLATPRNLLPIESFLASAGRPLADRVTIVPYADLFRMRAPPGGTYIFSDVERLDARDTRAARAIADALSERSDTRVLNHPARSMRRYELLRSLHEHGINQFDVHWARELPEAPRFPLFLRVENDHKGSRSPLLHSTEELYTAIHELTGRWGRPWRMFTPGHRRRRDRARHLLAVEHLDTADPRGVYRKYSAFAVHKTIVARHLFFSREWLVKEPVLKDEGLLLEEQTYVETNPHEAELRSIFERARIDYGRVDYALYRGRIQVWEINTNPMITRPGGSGPRASIDPIFAARFLPALLAA